MRRRELRLTRGAAVRSALGLGLGLALGLALASPPQARAQSCASADLRFTLPPDGATGVPVDSTLRAYYGVGARYASESVFLASGARRESLVGDFDTTTGVLSITSTTPLEPGTPYNVDWPALSSTGLPARGNTVSFTTGDSADEAPPALDAIASLEWDVIAVDDPCLGTEAERYTFDLLVSGARDDGGTSLLEASAYLTRGPLLTATSPPRLVATEAVGDGSRAIRVTLPRDDALGEVCFAALVRDLHGRTSAATPERCVVTEPPPFFHSCSATAPGVPRTGSAGPFVAFVALAFLAVRRRARQRPPKA